METLTSFLDISPQSDFSIYNLPYGVFQPRGEPPRVGVAIGDWVLDLRVAVKAGLLSHTSFADTSIFASGSLNAFMAQGPVAWRELRAAVQALLARENRTLQDNAPLRDAVLVRQSDTEMLLPAVIGDYTDFYSSYYHAHNVGTMLRGPEHALMPNWKHLPVAYHGRASSIVVSGTDIRRPMGQLKPADADAPLYAPSRNLDFELETGFFIGGGNALGEPVPIARADRLIFGMALVNDWSARDVQTWESQPFGPFLSKNFATSISPWVVPLDALEPFKRPLPAQDPQPLAYLTRPDDWLYDMQLEVALQTETMAEPYIITRSNLTNLYWSMNQQLAHHTMNGCNLCAGDLLASGTVSGPEPESRGCLLERTWRGTQPLTLPNGETRRFLEDGDRVTMRAWCERDGIRVGLGTVTGKVLPAIT